MKQKNKRLENYILENFFKIKFAVEILINLIFISKLLDSFIFFSFE